MTTEDRVIDGNAIDGYVIDGNDIDEDGDPYFDHFGYPTWWLDDADDEEVDR